jgi:hypothetical protein
LGTPRIGVEAPVQACSTAAAYLAFSCAEHPTVSSRLVDAPRPTPGIMVNIVGHSDWDALTCFRDFLTFCAGFSAALIR